MPSGIAHHKLSDHASELPKGKMSMTGGKQNTMRSCPHQMHDELSDISMHAHVISVTI
jgi:hypothetical protein